jgi:hypothetical protein
MRAGVIAQHGVSGATSTIALVAARASERAAALKRKRIAAAIAPETAPSRPSAPAHRNE